VWSLGKSVGDEIEYADEKGQRFRLHLVGMIGSSILQGSLLIAENEFVRRFPSEDGYRMFLIDAPEDKVDKVMEKLSDRLQDFGLELTPAKQRLAQFNAVENTYLSIFQLLGGLGLILGSVCLGLVVLRNMLERRGELAMLQAVGLNKKSLKKMVLYEHSGLMLCGLVCGVVAALIAVAPALKTPGAEVPYSSLALTVFAIGTINSAPALAAALLFSSSSSKICCEVCSAVSPWPRSASLLTDCGTFDCSDATKGPCVINCDDWLIFHRP
jgi:ABC-type antimicrobial peptide transport system permease subunit